MAPPSKKRSRPASDKSTGNSRSKRIKKANGIKPKLNSGKNVRLDDLAWKEVSMPDRLDDVEGFFGLEEVGDVEVVREDGVIKFVKVNGPFFLLIQRSATDQIRLVMMKTKVKMKQKMTRTAGAKIQRNGEESATMSRLTPNLQKTQTPNAPPRHPPSPNPSSKKPNTHPPPPTTSSHPSPSPSSPQHPPKKTWPSPPGPLFTFPPPPSAPSPV